MFVKLEEEIYKIQNFWDATEGFDHIKVIVNNFFA